MQHQPNPTDRAGDDRSVGTLIRQLMRELTSLVQNEAALAKAEVSEKVTQVESGIASLVIALVLLLVGLIGVMDAAIYGLAKIWPFWLSALVIGGALVFIGLIALFKGRSNLKSRNLAPNRMTAEWQKEAAFAKDQVR